MTFVAYIALFGWIPAIVILYALLPARLVSAIAVIGAWLLLPPVSIPICQFPRLFQEHGGNDRHGIGYVVICARSCPSLSPSLVRSPHAGMVPLRHCLVPAERPRSLRRSV